MPCNLSLIIPIGRLREIADKPIPRLSKHAYRSHSGRQYNLCGVFAFKKFNNMRCLQAVGVVLIWIQLCLTKGEGYEDDELQLLDRLLNNSQKIREIRPSPLGNHAKPVVITFDVALSRITDLDSKNQVLVSEIWVRQFWNNPRLTWNPADYGGITSINLSPQLVWRPDILLYNNINEQTGGEMFKFDTMVILTYDGNNSWFAPSQTRSICKIDITYFPFDEQFCKLVFGSWTYTRHHLDLVVKSNSADLTAYTSNGQWHLVSVKSKKNTVFYSCCDHAYVDITFTMHVRRRSLFYVYNLILPCILLATLSTFSFSLPPGSGERIALVITILLGLTVYMLIFTENIPQTSEVLPLISKFFIAVLFEVALCLIATSLTLRFYHYNDPEQDMSVWLRFIVFDCLAGLLCMKSKDPQIRQRNNPSLPNLNQSPRSIHKLWQCGGTNFNSSTPESIRKYPKASEGIRKHPALKHDVEGKIADILSKLSDIHKHVEQTKESETNKEHWHFAAMVIDRFFMYLSAVSFLVSTLVFYVVIPQYDNNAL